MDKIFSEYLGQCPVIAILRGITPDKITGVCDVLYNAGIRLLEVPLNSPEPFKSIEKAANHCTGRQLVGAGTVLTPEDAASVAKAGGGFVISPNTNPDVIRETKRLGMISIPGFFTATEAFAAQSAGADYLKLFPAILGPGYVKDLKAVVKTPILAVGGVNEGNLSSFMKVCAGAGIGSAIYKPGKSLTEISQAAASIVAKIN